MESNNNVLMSFTVTPDQRNRQQRRADFKNMVRDPRFHITMAYRGAQCHLELLLAHGGHTSVKSKFDSYKQCGEHIGRHLDVIPTEDQIVKVLNDFWALLGIWLKELNGNEEAMAKEMLLMFLSQPVNSMIPEIVLQEMFDVNMNKMKDRAQASKYRAQAATWLTLGRLFDISQMTPVLENITEFAKIMTEEAHIDADFKLHLLKCIVISMGFLNDREMQVFMERRLNWLLRFMEEQEADEVRELGAAAVSMMLIHQRDVNGTLYPKLKDFMKKASQRDPLVRKSYKFFAIPKRVDAHRIGNEHVKINSLSTVFLVPLLESLLGDLLPDLLKHSDKLREILKLMSLADKKKSQMQKQSESAVSPAIVFLCSLFD